MKLDIEVENLGKLKKGTIKVRPLTVLTGENGTGKSFFTKTLYSYFNVINKNLLHKEIIKNIGQCIYLVDIFNASLTRKGEIDKKNTNNLKLSLRNIRLVLSTFKDKNIKTYIQSCSVLTKKEVEEIDKFSEYLEKLAQKKKVKSVSHIVGLLKRSLSLLEGFLTNSESMYIKLLGYSLDKELRQNFQISSINELISFGEDKAILSATGLNISFNKQNSIDFQLNNNLINDISSLSRVVFFESPAYWSVRDALNKAKEVEKKDDLTGVSKYFYDLDKVLNTKSTSPALDIVAELVAELKTEIGGEFVFDNGRLSFVDNDGKAIDTNLISFGMTNLGMVQALLKNNVISKGSFVFFDEPETNLHPSWQVLLTKILIRLAKNGVNVVMATHSLDMIKALEVYTKGEDDNFIAVNHFTKEGGLLKFDSNDITENLIESRNKLANSYEKLFLEELYSTND